jgi:PKHD-type hydroxylase
MIYEIDLLQNEQLLFLQDKLKDLEYVDGNVSNPSPVKRNKICFDGGLYKRLNYEYSKILNQKIYKIFNVRRTSQLYFAEYNEGAKYGYHIDDIPVGGVFAHYSLTCFLNDPSQYEGGELVIKIGGKEIEYKLEAGKAVIYPTGLWHKVNEVKSGSRKVFVCWIESIIHNSFIRNYLAEFGNFIRDIDTNDDTLEKLEHFRMNLIREYGRI